MLVGRVRGTLSLRRGRHTGLGSQSVQLAYVDQSYTGEEGAQIAQEHDIKLEVVKHPALTTGSVGD
jgi:hypothetical protein